MTKIWFINVINENRKRTVEISYSGLGTSYIASYIQKYGGFRDRVITEIGQSLGSNLVRKCNPDIVGISSVTQNFNIAKEIGRKIKKELDVPVIVGGHHITALPNNLTEHMDVAVLGEGEQTFLELLNAYEENGLDKSKLSEIDGIAYRYKNTLIITPRREPIRPLDKIPYPARDLLKIRSNNLYMFTSRGCPYKCVFCSSSAFWHGYRFFSAEYVVDEIKELIEKHNAKCINLYDDLFIANKKRLKKIAQLIRKEKLDQEVSFACLARANLVDDETASLLRSMNVKHVSLGLESGSERILNYLKGGTVTVKQNENAVSILKKYKFHVDASFIIGSPTETKEDCLQTLNFLKRSKIYGGETYVLLPFPGTGIWEYGKQRGLLHDDMNWDNFEIYFEDNPSKRVITADNLSREELLDIFFLFKKEWNRRARRHLVHFAIRRPNKVIPFIYKKIKEWINEERRDI